MTRKNLAGVAVFASFVAFGAGCGRSTVSLTPKSELEVQVNGLALMDGGSAGFGGMFQQTCDFDTESGSIGKDYDAGPGLELVLDAAATRAVAVLDGALFELRQADGDVLAGRALGGEGVVHARLLDQGGLLTVSAPDSGGCWLRRGEEPGLGEGVLLPDEACSPGAALSVDRAKGTALIGGTAGLWRVQGDSRRELDGRRSDLLAFDAAIDKVYVGSRGGSSLRARHLDGALAWDTELKGTLVGVAPLTDQSAVLVALQVEKGVRLLALDAEDGQVVGVADIDAVEATALVADATGAVAGLLSPDRVRFFDVDAAD